MIRDWWRDREFWLGLALGTGAVVLFVLLITLAGGA